MSPIVVDASALVEVVTRSPLAADVEARFCGHDLVAPDLINQEVLSAVRRLRHRALIDEAAGRRAVENLVRAPLRRVVTTALLHRSWSLRHVVTSYDAAYVALAKRLGCPLITCDRALSRAPGLGVEVLAV